jgi:hypothetical protein
MKVSKTLVAAAAAAALLAGVANAQTVQQQVSGGAGQGIEAAQLVELQATILAIDLHTRAVKLKTKEGKELEVTAGPEVQRLADLRVGDEVMIQFYESLTLALDKTEGGVPASAEVSGESRNDSSELPGGVKVRQTTVLAKVTAVDLALNEVTVLTPSGESVILEVDAEVAQRVKVGDMVNAVYTEALAVAVSRPPAAQ